MGETGPRDQRMDAINEWLPAGNVLTAEEQVAVLRTAHSSEPQIKALVDQLLGSGDDDAKRKAMELLVEQVTEKRVNIEGRFL